LRTLSSPSQAAKSRLLQNAVIAATVALEMIGPIPATLINRSAGMPARKNFELRRRSQRAISQARSL
jgi:hypothetical protein